MLRDSGVFFMLVAPERACDIIAAGVIPQTSYNNTSPDDPNNHPKHSLLLHELEDP